MVHTKDHAQVRVLVVGNYALPVAKLALRYPGTIEVYALVDKGLMLRDKRMHHINSLDDLPKGFKADVLAVAVPGDPTAMVTSLRPYASPSSTIVVSFDTMSRGKQVLDAIKPLWPHIVPYVAHVPESALFFLLSDRKIGQPVRPFPPKLKKLTPGYMNSLFILAKDERRLLYGDMP
jgi:hypothetical protein